jgi:O-antigen ligase
MQVVPGAGVRLLGGAVGSPTTICPIIAIISAYSFRHSLEPRFRSTAFFLVGLAGTLIAQSRGTDLALLIVLAILAIEWGRTSKRSAYSLIAVLMTSLLITGVILGAIGGGRIWDTLNRGQDTSGIASASGRTDIWKFAIQYCVTHPQGMGYVAGFRSIFTKHFDLNFGADVSHLGTSHNAFIQYLVDGGWLGLAIYLLMLAKMIALGWRFAKGQSFVISAPVSSTIHAIRCGLLLLAYCLADGMDTSVFTIPLQEAFYYQNIIVAINLGACATMVFVSRPRYASFAK